MCKSSCPYYQPLKMSSRLSPQGEAFSGWIKKGASRLENNPAPRMGLFLLERFFHNTTAMQRKEWQQTLWRHSHPQQTDMAEEIVPDHPSVRTLLGSTDHEILDVAEHVHWGQYEVAPSTLPCKAQRPIYDWTTQGARPVPGEGWALEYNRNSPVSV